jgi:hypothetical protein
VAKFRDPPEPHLLARTKADEITLAAGTLLWRVYFRGGRYPTDWSTFRAFGPTGSRFDHHDRDPTGKPWVQSRKILYAALDVTTCLAEIFQEARTIDRRTSTPYLAAFRLATEVVLLDLTGAWPTRSQYASMVINSGPRPRARKWARAIYEAYPHIQGLHYASSMHANQPCVAVWERAEAAHCMPPTPTVNRALTEPGLQVVLINASAVLGYELV